MMKHGILITLLGFLVLWAAPTMAGPAVELLPDLAPDQAPIAVDNERNVGPRRDPYGEDWIIYDDGNAQLYFPSTNLYARVIFTPNTQFRLQGMRMMPLNHRNSQAAFNAYVYEEDQGNHNLTNRLVTKALNQLPAWDNNNWNNNWQEFEFDENEYHEFDQGESFSIVFGVCPGGDANQANTGYWPYGDGAGDARRSYVTRVANLQAAVPTNHQQAWAANQVASDILIRANGEYLADFVDIGVLDVFNGDPDAPLTGQYLMYPGTRQELKAQIANFGMDLGVAVVNFQVKNADDEIVYDWDMVTENFDGGDTTVVVSDSLWSTDEVGRYRVFVTLTADDDSNPDNNQGSLDQIVFDPAEHPDDWIGYVDDQAETSTGGSDGIGWAAMFNHPGGEDVLCLTGIRVAVAPEEQAEEEVRLLVARVDLVQRQLSTIWADTLLTDNSGNAQWVEAQLSQEEINTMTFTAGQAVMITYLNNDNARILIDSDPPLAGTNNHMPSSMMITFDDGQGYNGAGSGDYMIEGKLGISDLPPEGALLRIIPDTLDFGDSLAMGVDHVIEALIICYGSDTVTVTSINPSASIRNYVTISHNAFTLASRDTQRVTITFRANQQMNLNSQLLITSNWENHRNFTWKFYASTFGGAGVNENVRPGVPEAYSLGQNFPNPFNPTTTIEFALPLTGDVSFQVFDMNGRQVGEKLAKSLHAGYHSIEFDASSLPAGIYAYKLTSGDFSSVKKMVLMK